jgi:hypothetical protein
MVKKKTNMMDIVKSGIILGTGAVALGSMNQGAIAQKIITPAANMYGVTITAGMGMGVLNMVSEKIKNKRGENKWQI